VVCEDFAPLHPFFNALVADQQAKVLLSTGKWVLFDLGIPSNDRMR
jgi:hypothetical protein